MIIVKLIGGLGNQMFQYAVGRRLALKLNVELKLDITGFDNYKLRKYSLSNFKIQENIATLQEINSLTKPTISQRLCTKILHMRPKDPKTYVCEKQFHFDPNILNLFGDVYMEGYWQSEKYFVDIAEIIRQEFTLKDPQVGKNSELAEHIASSESVSIHIRRGDYVSDSRTNKLHGCCNIEYYICCLEHLTQIIANPHLYIFSDDPSWVSENLKITYPMTIIDQNRIEKDYEDLRLMSQCRHHIIANSTFSWWGAWLNPRIDKIVIAPKQWFSEEEQSLRIVNDLIPSSWVVL
jgi:hypothetical protein